MLPGLPISIKVACAGEWMLGTITSCFLSVACLQIKIREQRLGLDGWRSLLWFHIRPVEVMTYMVAFYRGLLRIANKNTEVASEKKRIQVTCI